MLLSVSIKAQHIQTNKPVLFKIFLSKDDTQYSKHPSSLISSLEENRCYPCSLWHHSETFENREALDRGKIFTEYLSSAWAGVLSGWYTPYWFLQPTVAAGNAAAQKAAALSLYKVLFYTCVC